MSSFSVPVRESEHIPRRIAAAGDNLFVKAVDVPQPGRTMHTGDPSSREEWCHRAVLSGDERAWQELYEQVYDGLYRYVSWRCGSDADRTEEIVQETWMTAIRRIRVFDPQQGRFLSWLRGIAAHILRNHFRSRNGKVASAQSLISEPPVERPPEQRLEQQERTTRIASTLSALSERHESERHEEVLRAKYVDQFSIVEIAHMRNESPKAIESLLTRAREAFRREYEKREI